MSRFGPGAGFSPRTIGASSGWMYAFALVAASSSASDPVWSAW